MIRKVFDDKVGGGFHFLIQRGWTLPMLKGLVHQYSAAQPLEPDAWHWLCESYRFTIATRQTQPTASVRAEQRVAERKAVLLARQPIKRAAQEPLST